ncbi:hypothetical protein HPB52_012079 [Rhipicephalus sanguineus]|uniref:Uncharacterized protein n=1 Tax=Rhipicephalus sanguineus TaxID=34632 RepID=A0A9D4PZT6_RHISA|nr:hypothetical protein HPB52_012079 [Rhipicephalus sanguineus]
MEPVSPAAEASGDGAEVKDIDFQQGNTEMLHESASEEGWHTIKRRRSRGAGKNKESGVDSDRSGSNAEAGSKDKTQTKTQDRLLGRIEKTSRMPRLPAGDYKVVIRPRGGLCVAQLGPTEINRCVYEAAGIPFEERQFDVICPNKTQNILVVSTPDPDRADQYRRIKQINARGKAHEVAAYETAPEDTSKGVIRGIPLDETPSNIISALVTARNPKVITAKRLGNTTTVIVLFSGNRVPTTVCYAGQIDFCRQCNRIGHRGDVCPNPTDRLCPGCGAFNPNGDHTCEPKCRICGKDHATADRNCKAKFKKPFIVKQRQWARIQDDQRQAPSQWRGRSPSRSRSRSRGRQRMRSTTRGSTPARSQPRSRSTSRESTNTVSWADKVRGSRPVETGESVKHNNEELEKLKAENIQMREMIAQLHAKIEQLSRERVHPRNYKTPLLPR